MTKAETERLLLSFPDDPAFLGVLFPGDPSTGATLEARLRAGLWNPSLLWDIAQSYAQFCQPLPDIDLPRMLERAHGFLTDANSTDENMALARMLHLPDYAVEADLIDAALIGEDLTRDQIAEIFHYAPDVIGIEDQVFFNFRDRRSDRFYVSHYSDSIRSGSSGAEVKRLALLTRKAKLALAAAQILPPQEMELPAETLVEQIEGELLRLAIAGLRKGLIGRSVNPALALVEKYLLPLRQKQSALQPFHGLQLCQEDLGLLYRDLNERLDLLRGEIKGGTSSTNKLEPP